MPEHYSRIFGQSEKISSGGLIYSEGIFEDINKALYAGFFWNGNNEWKDTLREYCRYEFLSEDTEEFISLVRAIELSHPGFRLDLAPKDESGIFARRVTMPENGLPNAVSDREQFRRFEKKLSPDICKTWRWRQLMIRAEIDAELAINNGKISEKMDALLEELELMYRIDPARALPRVAPPTKAYRTLTV